MQQPSDPQREERLEALFHQVLSLPDSERADHLAAATAGDPTLRAELDELLDAHAGAPDYLDAPAVTPERLVRAEAGVEPGTRLGPYVLQRLLGEGGMGAVYLADQDQPLRRRVAIKLIKPGMDTREVLARFEGERQVLARLSHPNIAAVHDAGSTPLGRPFFVMEYVDGERLDQYCDRRELPLEARLEIAAQVCDAVHHAHCQGVIHRDLTPGNVLIQDVAGVAVPKIIDFGVAKAVDRGGAHGTVCTRGGQPIGTPGYMSPEQAAGDRPVDSRTDVFSLGVLLQELLTGLPLMDRQAVSRASSDEERLALLREAAARPASQRLDGLAPGRLRRLARRRGLEGPALSRALRGDLDWIVHRALQPDPEQRYASASALAADLRRHLRHEPVSAGPPSLAYRARKLAAAHRPAVAGLGVALLMGVAAVAAVAWTSGVRDGEQATLQALGLQASDEDAPPRRDELGPVPGRLASLACQDCVTPPFDTVSVRNAGRRPLPVGHLVEVLDGDGPTAEVDLAVDGSGLALLGAVAGWYEQDGEHRHLRSEPVAVGALAEVAVRGPWAAVAVAGPVRPDQGLTLSARPGLARAATDGEALIGRAVLGSRGSGPTLIKAHIARSWPVVGSDGLAGGGGAGVLLGGVTGGVPAAEPLLAGGAVPGAGPLRSAEPSDGGPGDVVPPVPETKSGTHAGHGLTGTALAGRSAPRPTLLVSVGQAPSLGQAPEGSLGMDLRVGGGHGGDGMHGAHDSQLTHDLVMKPAQAAGPESLEQAWGHADSDGLPDLLSSGPGGTRLLRNLGQGLFEDLTEWSGLDAGRALHAIQWVDLDGDGQDDLLALDAQGQVLFARGQGGAQFNDQTELAGLITSVPAQSLELVPTGTGTPPDVSLVLADGSVVLLHNDAQGHFQQIELVPALPTLPDQGPALGGQEETEDDLDAGDDSLLKPAAGGGLGGAPQAAG